MGVRKYIQRAAIFPLMVVIFLPGMVSCSSDEPEEKSPENSRDAFVGEYDYTSTGNIEFTSIGVKPMSIPLYKEGSFTIAKEAEDNKVAIVGAILGEKDSIHAIVTGNQLMLEQGSTNYTEDDLNIQMMLSYDKATLTDNQLVWDADILGVASYSGISVNCTGHLSVVAVKQGTK